MEASAKKINALFYVISTYVILTFIWRFLVPATEESEPNSLIYIEILFEVVQIAALIALFSYLRSYYDNPSAAILISVFLIALMTAIGILVLRFSSDHGWYTGHRIYYPGGYRS
jgi:hypothetical protein